MSPFRYRDEPTVIYAEEEESGASHALYIAIGAAAGFAAGVLMADRFGGFKGLTDRIAAQFGSNAIGLDAEVDLDDDGFDDEFDEDFDDDFEAPVASLDATEELEERVLEAFRNDPLLSERAIDIGAVEDGIIELTGWVNSDDEGTQAVVIARGVPGVETVVNRLAIKADEDLFEDAAHRYEDGDPTLTEAHWEGQHVGTGRRRQGNSTEVDRHADPRTVLEDRSMNEESAFMSAADEMEAAERRKKAKKAARGGRTDGSPVAPTGVPKADHVADPLHAPADVLRPRPEA